MNTAKVLELVSNDQDAHMARVAQRWIMAALDRSRGLNIVLVEDGQDAHQDASTINLPPQSLRAIADLLGMLAQQQPVLMMPLKRELTTQEVAVFLNVSRPYVIRQIESGALKCRKVGMHRRVEFQELMRFKRDQDLASDEALQRLSDFSQEIEAEHFQIKTPSRSGSR